jgi:hypothetical protein
MAELMAADMYTTFLRVILGSLLNAVERQLYFPGDDN